MGARNVRTSHEHTHTDTDTRHSKNLFSFFLFCFCRVHTKVGKHGETDPFIPCCFVILLEIVEFFFYCVLFGWLLFWSKPARFMNDCVLLIFDVQKCITEAIVLSNTFIIIVINTIITIVPYYFFCSTTIKYSYAYVHAIIFVTFRIQEAKIEKWSEKSHM